MTETSRGDGMPTGQNGSDGGDTDDASLGSTYFKMAERSKASMRVVAIEERLVIESLLQFNRASGTRCTMRAIPMMVSGAA